MSNTMKSMQDGNRERKGTWTNRTTLCIEVMRKEDYLGLRNCVYPKEFYFSGKVEELQAWIPRKPISTPLFYETVKAIFSLSLAVPSRSEWRRSLCLWNKLTFSIRESWDPTATKVVISCVHESLLGDIKFKAGRELCKWLIAISWAWQTYQHLTAFANCSLTTVW